MQPSGGAGHPHRRASGKAYGWRGSGPPPAGLPVRRGRMFGRFVATPMHLGQGQAGTVGADPSPESPVAAGPGHATERRVRKLSSAASGVGTPVGPTGPVGHPLVLQFRAIQHEIPAVPGGHGGQPDPNGGGNGSVGQSLQRFQQLGHCPYRGRRFRLYFHRCAVRQDIDTGLPCVHPTAQVHLPEQGFPARILESPIVPKYNRAWQIM